MQYLLSGNNLVKPDRMGMAVSLEARTPFLDYRMMELAFKMPGSLKLKNGETKYIMKKAVSPLIGSDLAYRKKQMFTVPIGDWLRSNLAPQTRALLLSEKAMSRGLFEPSKIAQMLEDHETSRHNFTREIRALVSLEIWYQIFVDDKDHRNIAVYT
jgi:asparagine synthase (glutamine-hydrolysing)